MCAGWLLFTLLVPVVAQAQPRALHFDTTESLLLGTPLLLGVAIVYLLPSPASCTWCEPGGFDESLGSRLSSVPAAGVADFWSDVGLYGLGVGAVGASAAGALTKERSTMRGVQDLHIVLEAMALTALLTRTTKLLVARRRPAVHTGNDVLDGENPDTSFPSGHAGMTATMAASLATVAYMRDYRWKHGVAIGGGLVALVAGSLRIVSLRHWPTDVLVGWVVGTAVGILVPRLMHDPSRRRAGAATMGTSTLVMLRF